MCIEIYQRPPPHMNPVSKIILSLLLFCSFTANAVELTKITALPYPKANYGTGEHKNLVQRGEYLTKMGDCIACHTDTKHGGIPFAGGLGIQTPFGTFYSQNITPDKDTGIGKWSDKEFIRAMQHGISPKGYNYFPVFPYTSFTRVTEDDLLAIKAYLLSIPPIHKAAPKNNVSFPFSWRFLQYGWKLLFFEPYKGVYKYEPNQSVDWNRGAYIVQGLGHCGECHTPRNLFGGMKYKYALTGAFIEGYYAANVTAHGLEGVPSNEVVEVFTKNKKYKGAGQIGGPMLEVNLDSLRYMTKSDLNAIVTYLKTVKSKEPEIAKKSAVLGADAGEDIYAAHCGICHDSGAAGAPKLGDASDWGTRLQQGMPTIVEHAINGYNSMPPRGACITCSDQEIKAAIDYIYSKSKAPTEGAAGATPPKVVKLTLADGKKIYESNCIVCHGEGKLGSPKLGDKEAWTPIVAKNFDVLIEHTLHGYKRMPARGTCVNCSDAEIIAAIKYMVQQSHVGGDYSLW
jgi:cytochrome c5